MPTTLVDNLQVIVRDICKNSLQKPLFCTKYGSFDLSGPPPHQVFIRVQDSNDNPPVFSQPAYDVSVSEDVPVDVELARVRASDLDERARLSYSIYGSVDPASMRLFRVNPGTGVVYTTDRLDYEARTQHILTIMVRREAKDAVCVGV